MTSEVLPRASPTAEPVVEIRRPAAFFGLLAFLLGMVLLWIAYSTFSRDWTLWDPKFWMMVAILIGLIWVVVDRRPVLVLDAQGIRDRRLGSALLPWSDLRRVEALAYTRLWSGGQVGVRLHFGRSVPIRSFWQRGSANDIFVRMYGLDIEPAQFVEYVQRFAPHVTLDTKLLEIR